MLGCVLGYLVNVFYGHTGNSVQQWRMKSIGSGQEEGQVSNVARVYLIDHPVQRDQRLFQQHLLEPLSWGELGLVQHQVQPVGRLQPLAAALAQPLQQADVLAVGVVSVRRISPYPLGNGKGDGVELAEVALCNHFVHVLDHALVEAWAGQHGEHPGQHGHLIGVEAALQRAATQNVYQHTSEIGMIESKLINTNLTKMVLRAAKSSGF